jgi:tetratricopeptide (TPR) repeat protein
MQKARETGDPTLYERAAAAVDRAEATGNTAYDVLRTRAWIALGRHEFTTALRAARAARRQEPRDAWNLANLADACLELGRYASALRATDRLTALRPGVTAYTRVAALRALLGDRRGAIAALELALAAADPDDTEQRAWILTYMAHEHWAVGNVGAATAAYEAALATFPDFHLALPGLARVRAAEGRLADAIALYQRALDRAPTTGLAEALGDVQRAAGDPAAARATYEYAMHMVRMALASGRPVDHDVALFLADPARDPALALTVARATARTRHDVVTDDVLAWTFFRAGRPRAAKRAASRALRLGTEDAAMHYHLGTIAAALDRPRTARRHLARALASNPRFDLRHAVLARATLDALSPSVTVAAATAQVTP